MIELFEGFKRWYNRYFKGIVAPPRQYGGHGTIWQQWPKWRSTFFCPCGYAGEFTPDTYVIRHQEHKEDCFHLMLGPEVSAHALRQSENVRCTCPVTDARYVKICPNCKRGHWKEVATT